MAYDLRHSYTGPYKFNEEGDLYIHQHQYCIGKAMNGPEMSDASLSRLFASQKETAAIAAKTYYQTLFIDNLHLSKEEFQLLQEAMEVDAVGLIGVIEKAGKEKMAQMMNRESLEKLLVLKTDAATASRELFSAKTKNSLQSFNDIIGSLIETTKLMESDYGKALGQMLSNLIYKRNIGPQAMGQKLYLSVEDFARKNKISTCNDQHIKKAVAALKTFSKTLSTMKTTTGEDVTSKNIVNIVDSLYDPFSEIIASIATEVVDGEAKKVIGTLSGTDTHRVMLTDTAGRMTGFKGEKAAGKTDFSFDNVVLELQHGGGGDNKQVSLKIGISNKLYRAHGFSDGTGNNIPNISFGGGSGGTLQEAIESIFPNERGRSRYLAYNAFGHWESLDLTTAALNDLLLTRQIVRIFATRGGSKDFSQYIFVNGEVVSVLDLLMYVTDPTTSLGKSKTKLTKNTNQAAAISIAGRPALKEAIKIRDAMTRTKKVNEIVNTTTITAYVHVHKLIQSLNVS